MEGRRAAFLRAAAAGQTKRAFAYLDNTDSERKVGRTVHATGHFFAAKLPPDVEEVDINTTVDKMGRNALTLAVENGHAFMVSALLARGANPRLLSHSGSSPLHTAVRAGQADIAEMLLAAGADPMCGAETSSGTPLMAAAAGGDLRTLRTVIHAIARASQRKDTAHDMLGADALRCGVRGWRGKDTLLAALNQVDKDGATALMYACGRPPAETALELIDLGASIHTVSNTGSTALFAAVACSNVRVIQQLLARGADVKATTRSLDTVLLTATQYGDPTTVRLIVEAGGDPCAANAAGAVPLHAAVRRRRSDVLSALLEAVTRYSTIPVNVDLPSVGGEHALLTALRNGDTASANVLLEFGAHVDIRDEEDWTPLQWAACAGNDELVRSLLLSGADVNARNRYRRNALWYAAYNGHHHIIPLLLGAGARLL